MQTIEQEKPQEQAAIPVENNAICDSCGGTVPASYHAQKNNYSLNFCGHHIRRHAEQLLADGFTITPEDFSFEAYKDPDDVVE